METLTDLVIVGHKTLILVKCDWSGTGTENAIVGYCLGFCECCYGEGFAILSHEMVDVMGLKNQ